MEVSRPQALSKSELIFKDEVEYTLNKVPLPDAVGNWVLATYVVNGDKVDQTKHGLLVNLPVGKIFIPWAQLGSVTQNI